MLLEAVHLIVEPFLTGKRHRPRKMRFAPLAAFYADNQLLE
jgi:hypothetical protein